MREGTYTLDDPLTRELRRVDDKLERLRAVRLRHKAKHPRNAFLRLEISDWSSTLWGYRDGLIDGAYLDENRQALGHMIGP
jgi:hypothetical protein